MGIAGLLLLAISALYFPAMRILCIGVNDAEWARIAETGKFSGPNEITWSGWAPSNEDYQRPQSWGEAAPADTVRSGVAESLFLTFTVYEARSSTLPDSASSWAIIGPDWGASVRPWFPIALGAIGVAMALSATSKMKKANKADQSDALQRPC